jgi:hypothetical protein
MPYYDVQIKQLVPVPPGQFLVVYNPGTKDEFTETPVFFALCDLIEHPLKGEILRSLENEYGAILPVVFWGEDEGGFEVEVTREYIVPGRGRQEICVRKIKQD